MFKMSDDLKGLGFVEELDQKMIGRAVWSVSLAAADFAPRFSSMEDQMP
jgi:hypothetical protein